MGGSGNWGTALFIHRLSTAGTGNLAEFQYNNSFVGSINTNGSTTTYNPSSDYRLKQDVENISIGDSVKVVFEKQDDDFTIPKFEIVK